MLKLSAPIYQLKRKAKQLSRERAVPLHEALNTVAAAEGFRSWSLLAAKYSETAPAIPLFEQMDPGDLVLLGARPGHGKTLLSLELAVEAVKAGKEAYFFTLEYTDAECRRHLESIDGAEAHRVMVDCSDEICADYIARRLHDAASGSLAVVDYLQLLDQRRENPDLSSQIRALRAFAKHRGLILVFISQIDRSFDPGSKPFPGLEDVRLPNPLDLKLFDKTCFLNEGEVRFSDRR